MNISSTSTGKQVHGSLLNQMQTGLLSFDYKRGCQSQNISNLNFLYEEFYSSERNQLRKFVVCRWFVFVVLFPVVCKSVSDIKLLLFSLTGDFFSCSVSNAAIFTENYIMKMLWFNIEMRHELPCHSRLETYIYILKVITGELWYIRNSSPYGNVLHTKKY